MSKTKSKTKANTASAKREDARGNEILRIQKKRNNFVMLDKDFINDERLSLKAKGLLTYLLSKPDQWKVIVKDIVNHCKDGQRAVYSGLNELKQYGYYHKYPVREGQRIVRWESVVCECPEEYQEDLKDIEKKNNSKKKEQIPMEKPQDSLLCGFVQIQNEEIQSVHIQNGEHSNININKNQPNQNDISIYQTEQKTENKNKNDTDTATPTDTIDNTNKIIKVFSKQEVADKISLQELREKHSDKAEELDMLYEIMCEVLTVDNPVSPTFRISRQNIPFITVKDTFNQIQKEHIEYVLHSLNNNDNKYKINKNTKSYCMTSLFHAPRTISYYFNRSFTPKPVEKSKWEILFEKKIERDSMNFDFSPEEPFDPDWQTDDFN